MDRDVALTLNTKLTAINTALQNIVTGIVNTAEVNRSFPINEHRLSQDEEPEPVEPEPVNKK